MLPSRASETCRVYAAPFVPVHFPIFAVAEATSSEHDSGTVLQRCVSRRDVRSDLPFCVTVLGTYSREKCCAISCTGGHSVYSHTEGTNAFLRSSSHSEHACVELSTPRGQMGLLFSSQGPGATLPAQAGEHRRSEATDWFRQVQSCIAEYA